MEIIILSFAAFAVAILTFFSGFGLATVLTPLFMIYFPADLAVSMTGIVHFFNNLFKLFLVGKKANKGVALRFGIPAIIAAIAGSWLLISLPASRPLVSYTLFNQTFDVQLLKLIISLLLITFASLDLFPRFKRLQFEQNKLPLGGLLSGFFGGLSGNQGALRSAFLIKAKLSKEAFIGTTVVVAVLVDFTRLSIYATQFNESGLNDNLTLISSATLAAIAGAYVGDKSLKKVTLRFLQITIAILLIILSLALGSGLI